jgi:hypothetical protein
VIHLTTDQRDVGFERLFHLDHITIAIPHYSATHYQTFYNSNLPITEILYYRLPGSVFTPAKYKTKMLEKVVCPGKAKLREKMHRGDILLAKVVCQYSTRVSMICDDIEEMKEFLELNNIKVELFRSTIEFLEQVPKIWYKAVLQSAFVDISFKFEPSLE